ncbi:MAG TPA: CHAT domain-containing protein [Jatrophihabitans sp.]|jgi:hypothetical protein
MNRTVITFQPAGRSILVSLDRAPILFEPNSTKVNLTKIVGDSLVDRGKAILKLITARDPVRAGLNFAFALPENAPPAPLYFHVRADAADVVAWEQIYDDHLGFCALDARWPIGRIASTVRQVAGQAFTPPLRLVAVLAAAGRDANAQLRALCDATSHSAVPTSLHVITGDDDLANAAGAAGASAELISGTSPQVCRQIAAAQPHLLHVFCHGGVVANAATLAFATAADVDAGRDDYGSVRVFVPDLVRALSVGSNPWLVVLNACETAAADGGTGEVGTISNGAIAHDMVSAGLTAVIGMRRKVELQSANTFCALLYPEVLSVVADALTAAKADPAHADVVIDWAPALTAPRRALSGPDPSNADGWLDPVLYAQSDDLHIAPTPPGDTGETYARLNGQRDSFVAFLASLDAATANHDVITAIHDRIAAIDAQLAAGTANPSAPQPAPVPQ